MMSNILHLTVSYARITTIISGVETTEYQNMCNIKNHFPILQRRYSVCSRFMIT